MGWRDPWTPALEERAGKRQGDWPKNKIVTTS